MIKNVINHKKKLIVVDPRNNELAKYADYWFQYQAGNEYRYPNGLMHVIVKEKLYDATFVEGRTEGFENS